MTTIKEPCNLFYSQFVHSLHICQQYTCYSKLEAQPLSFYEMLLPKQCPLLFLTNDL